jgi:uncharacterized protein YukE
MTRIRVNTDDLIIKAKDFDSAADSYYKAGDEILSVAMSMPSYEGQLSNPARAAGYEIQSQTRYVNTSLSGIAQSLRKTAQAFADADNQAIGVFSQSQESLLAASSLFGGFNPARSSGDSYLGYNYDPANPSVIIICMYGLCKKVIITPENKDIINDFILQVDGGSYTDPESGVKVDVKGYVPAKNDFNKATIAGIGSSVVIIGAGIALCFTGVGIPAGLVTAAGGVIGYAGSEYVEEQALSDMAKATSNAADDWNKLFPGDNQVGDPTYSVTDQGPGAGDPVYDPTPISSETPEP